jgi:O-antigen/teichoic acid export membrane protein
VFNVRHIAVNLIGAALPILVILVTVPLYLHAIGADKYGALSLVWIVFGYFGILDFGVSRSVTTAISRAEGRQAKADIIWSATALNTVWGAVIAVVGGGGFLAYAAHSGNEMVKDVVEALPLMMVGIPILMVTSTLNGALDGEERFKMANGLQLTGSILYQVVPLLTAYYVSDRLSVLITAVILCRMVLLLLYGAVVARLFDLLALFSVSKSTMMSLLKFGSSIAAVNILDPIFSRIDQVVIARLSGASDVAAYSIALNSIGRLSILPLAMSRSIFPKLSLGTMDDHRDDLFVAKNKIIWIWTGLCCAAILASDVVYYLWLRDPIYADVSAVAKVFVVGLWANCLSILPYTALQAGGRSMTILKAHLAEMPFYAVVLVVLTYYYGPIGAAAAYGVRNFADYLILWKVCGYALRRQGLFVALFAALSLVAYIMSQIHLIG